MNFPFKHRFFLFAFAAWLLAMHSACGQFWQPHFIPGGVNHQYNNGYYGGGVSMADFDMDGWDDVFLCSRGEDPLLLKSVDGDLQPWPSGIANNGEMKQVTWVDFDNDGDRDLSITGLDMPVRIFVNDGNTLALLPPGSGISAVSLVSYGHSWGDYDRDGDLDLFVCNYDAQFMGYVNSDNQLYRNEGEGLFTDVTLEAGFSSMVNYTFMSIWMDYNRDLYPDLLVINDRYEVPNYFYHNNGDGTFTEIGAQANLDDYIFGMTATADDYDNDGDLDIYVTNGTLGNFHKRNNGNGTFTDVAQEQGTTLNRFCWSAQFVDANRDGWQDLHICSTPHISLSGQNFLYLNNGQTYSNATDTAGIATDNGWSRSSALGDFNRDGLADVTVSKSSPNNSTFWSAVPNANHWLKVTLEGVQSNRDGVSTWIDLFSGGQQQTRYTFCGEGYLAQNSFSEFFGIGQSSVIDSLVLHWPSGIVDRWHRMPADQQLYLVEGSSQSASIVSDHGNTLCVNDSLQFGILGEWMAIAWNAGGNDSTITISAEGPLVALINDEWGNTFLSDTVWVVLFGQPAILMNVLDVSCNGLSDGVIALNSDEPLQLTMNGIAAESNVFSELEAGSYELVWEDEHGCFGSVQAAVEQPQPFLAQAIVQHVSCAGGSDGAVLFEYSGGTPDYFLLGTNPVVSDMTAGDYLYTALDANGCVKMVLVTITEPEALVMEITATPETNESLNGSIACTVDGGSPPYVYSLDGVLQSDAVWFNLAQGIYIVSVTDSLGCTQQQDALVDALTGIDSSASVSIEIFPNPTKQGDPIHIHSQSPIELLGVFSTDGRLIYQSKRASNDAVVPSHDLQAGVYYVRVVSCGVVSSHRLVIVQ